MGDSKLVPGTRDLDDLLRLGLLHSHFVIGATCRLLNAVPVVGGGQLKRSFDCRARAAPDDIWT